MSNFSALKTAIQNAIKQNGNEEITGNLLQNILLSIVETLGDSAINTLETNLSNEATARGDADTQLNNLITGVKNNVDNGYVYAGIATPSTTPVSGKVFYIALQAGTYTNFGSQVVLGGITILKYNGSAWSKEQVLYTDGGVFDISAYNATGGELAKYADLTAALGTNGANIPQPIRKGGMSVKFVQSSDNKYDNKYVQYLYLGTSVASADFTNITNWEKVVLEEKVEYLLSLSKKNEEVFSTILSGADSVSIPICFEIGDICKVKNLSTGSCSVYLTDFSGNTVQTISAGTLLQNDSIDFIVNTDDAVRIGGYCSTGYNLEFSIKSPKSLEILSQTTQKINNNLKEQYIYKIPSDVELTLVEDKIIAPSGVVMSGAGSAFHVSDAYQISPNQKLSIHASALYGNCYYAIYDENNNVLLRENQTGSVYEKQITVIAPADSHHICISWVGGYTLSSMSVADIILNGKSWSDLKWVCFGDSLTEVNSNAKKKYYNYAQEELGISPLVYGVSGTGYFKNYGAGNNNFLTRIEQLANVDFDIITFFGSFNDLDGGWIGGSIDSTDTTQNNICGFINATLNRLYEIKPFVKVGIITPTPWYNSFTLSECSEYATKLKQIAEKRSLPCLDLFRCSNLHPDKENFRIEFYKEDGVQDNGTHPNSLGHLRIYPQFREFLKSML